MSNLTPLFTACPPRPIQQAGEQYAADVIRGLNEELASEAAAADFLEATHLTKATADFLRMAMDRIALGRSSTSPSVYQLYSRYGGGKTHSLLLLAAAARYPRLRYWQETAQCNPATAKVIAFDGEKHNVDGAELDEQGNRARSLAGYLLYQLGGPTALREFAEGDEILADPGSDAFRRLMGDEPVIFVIDEAHRARFRDVDHEPRRQPNQYLKLLRQLSRRTRELLLLTATPMQLNEVELWALLELLEPEGWQTGEYRRFYQDEPPDLAEWKYRRDLWRKTGPPDTGDFLLSSDNDDYIAESLKEPGALQDTLALMQRSSPAKRLMSRHTRELLRQYRRLGLLDAPVPQRRARDVVITMTPSERALYDGIKELVRQCYAGRGITPQSLGFITTIFRKRFGSSTNAYAQTLRNAANRIRIPQDADDWITLLDDADLDELTDGETDALNRAANLDALLKAADEAERLAQQDSKRGRLTGVITELREQGHNHILLFTQFRDTQSWLSEHLQRAGHYVTELYGQDAPLGDRGRRLDEFRQQEQGILLCTETASESLNLQFCSSVINYDIPWNPMTLEQRAGRIDRIGQDRSVVDVVNLFYEDTAEHDAYKAVERRFQGIIDNVGAYPPIIAANIQSIIQDGKDPDAELDKITARKDFDINRLNAEWDSRNAPLNPQITMDDLERALREPSLLPEGWEVKPVGGKHWEVIDPRGRARRITTDAESYQAADGRLRWWQGPWEN